MHMVCKGEAVCFMYLRCGKSLPLCGVRMCPQTNAMPHRTSSTRTTACDAVTRCCLPHTTRQPAQATAHLWAESQSKRPAAMRHSSSASHHGGIERTHLLVHGEDDVQAAADNNGLWVLRTTLFRSAFVSERFVTLHDTRRICEGPWTCHASLHAAATRTSWFRIV
jgi:hypothetical protein